MNCYVFVIGRRPVTNKKTLLRWWIVISAEIVLITIYKNYTSKKSDVIKVCKKILMQPDTGVYKSIQDISKNVNKYKES